MTVHSPKRMTDGGWKVALYLDDRASAQQSEAPAVITNAPFGAVTQPVRQARAKDVSYHGHWSADFSGTNSFVTDFRYEG